MKPITIDVGTAEQTYIFKTERGTLEVTVNKEDWYIQQDGEIARVTDLVKAVPDRGHRHATNQFSNRSYLSLIGGDK
jgi:hypothetical protein